MALNEKSSKPNNSLVSVIIPVYNGANYLKEAIDSVLAQTYDNVEIIVVDDGSVDDTEKIAKSYGDKIRYFAKGNGGVSTALNLAIKNSKGEYISWLSHDDIYYPDKIEKQIKFIDKLKNKNVILYSDYDFVDEKSQLIEKIKLNHEMLQLKPEYALLRSSINGNTLLIPKQAFDEYGYFDENLKCTQDYAMWYKMMQTYDFIHIPMSLIKYRIHPMQDTRRNKKFVTEGDSLWIKMMENLSFEKKVQLEGNDFNFYKEMSVFLKKTPYKKAYEFSQNKASEILSEKKAERFSIAFVSHSAGSYGAEKALLDTIDVLIKKDVFIYVILPSHGPLEEDLKVRSIYYSIENITKCIKNRNANIDDLQDLIFNNAIKIADVLSKVKPDVVFTITSVINEGAIAAKMLNIPHVWNIAEFGRKEHGLEYVMDEEERMEFINNFSDKIFFVSRALKEYYAKKIDISNKSFVFPPILSNTMLENNKDTGKKYFRSEKSFKIALVGSITVGKGQKDAILAIKELLEAGNNKRNIELVMAGIVGDQDYYEQLQNVVKENNLHNNITFAGHIDNPAELFNQADIALMCSIFEGFGRVTVEAMLAHCPVIGANSGATPELIKNSDNGFLYEPGDYKYLSDRIKYFMDNVDKIKEYGDNGYLFAKKEFNEGKIADSLFDELYELKEKKNAHNSSLEAFRVVLSRYNLITGKIKEQDELIRQKNQIIQQKNQEIGLMTSSKFWRIREFYIKFKNQLMFVFLNPKKFIKKYFFASRRKLKIFVIGENYNGTFYYRAEIIKRYSKKFIIDTNIDFETGAMDSLKEESKKMLEADIIVFIRPTQRESLDKFKILKDNKKTIIFDNDDLMSGIDNDNPHYLQFESKKEVYLELLRLADGVVCTTECLKNESKKNNTNSFVFPNYIDVSDFINNDKSSEKNSKIRILFSGSVNTRENMAEFIPFVKNINNFGKNIEIIFWGGDKEFIDEIKRLVSCSVIVVDRTKIRDYFKKLMSLNIDIALIPRADNLFNKCKSNCKFLEMSLAKIPTIAQGFVDGSSPYQQDIINESNGFICVNEEEWNDKLSKLLESRKLRKKISNNAYTYVSEKYDIQKNIEKWEDIITNIWKSKK